VENVTSSSFLPLFSALAGCCAAHFPLSLSANEHFWRWAGGRACRRDVCKLKFRFGRKMSASLSLFAAHGEQVVAHGKRGKETPACLLLAGGVAHCQK
jgi:hypothetical protein